jgi:cellobiose phosphorylase
MWIAPVLALITGLWLATLRAPGLDPASLLLLFWLLAPALAWFVSEPQIREEVELDQEQRIFLRLLARRVWAFFEAHVGPDDNWLPPDNIQEQPVGVIAHRTSPTNIGLALLANLTGHDFGYIPTGQLLARTEHTFNTMQALERHQGHFYNWYDTQSMQPLHPMYVSTVDSGNLAGHLLTLRPGLLSLIDQPILHPRACSGLLDTLRILLAAPDCPATSELASLETELLAIETAAPASLPELVTMLSRATAAIELFCDRLQPVTGSDDLHWWAAALQHQAAVLKEELDTLAPWAGQSADAGWSEFLTAPDAIPSLRQLAQLTPVLPLGQQTHSASSGDQPELPATLRQAIAQASETARARIATIERLVQQAGQMARMEFDFLYDHGNHLLAIGYNVSERRRDNSFYDLLASEARLASFVAIAQGQLPQEGWFALGRQLTTVGRAPLLLSWSGSMFEYLMPLLVMPTFERTLLDQTYRAAVARQVEYGQQRGVPWGISESGYHAFDANLNYQYRAFGVPGMGLKRGLADDLVIAPYASALALMVAPEAACANLQRLEQHGFQSRFGFYEAIDYTSTRLPRGKSHAVIYSYMAHHQGMSLLSLSYLLLDRPMQRRFESDPLFQATALLLHEKIPKAAAFYSDTNELSIIRTATSSNMEVPVRILNTPDTPIPEVQLLSNGRYHVMVTNAGGGSSRWKDLAITRWHEDSTRDNWGSFCYIRDIASGEFWSTAHQPTLKRPKTYEVIFSEGRAEFRRRDQDFDTHTEIVVSPEDDIELRRSHIINRSRTRRTLEITSYAEVVLAPAAADAAHPAFSNLFVQTEILAPQRAILCTRRPRSEEEHPPWLLHLMAVHGAAIDDISYDTDRMQFIGRNHTPMAPQAMLASAPLSGHQGSVLDPIVAIRYRITLEPEQTAIIDIVTGASETREHCLTLIGKYQDRSLADRVFELAWTHSQVVLRQLNATEGDAQLYSRLANCVLYPNALLRADASVLLRNRRGQSGLWSYAISGDFPIVLCQIRDPANIEIVRQLVQAHAYWRLKGLAVDLVIWNEDHAGYRQILQEQIMGLIAAGIESHVVDRPGGIFVRPGDQISTEDRVLLQTVARAIISDDSGTLAEQVNRHTISEIRIPRLKLPAPRHEFIPLPERPTATAAHRRDLVLANGIGGFSPDGREYVIVTRAGQATPAPWVNVIANPTFGTVISENGSAYTWSENAHEFRLTPWHNDPVSDSSGEAFYLRDEESARFWSPTPGPVGSAAPYVSRHGFGYSIFEHDEGGIHSELCVYVALDAAVKFSVLKVRNDSGRARRLSATGYVEWVMGDMRAKSNMHIVTEADSNTGALFAHNEYNTEFVGRIAFFDVDDTARSFSGDRTEFLGRNGSLRHPAAMERVRLSGKVGAGLDPCAAIQVPFELADGEQREIVFKLGVAGRRSADASSLIRRFRGSVAAHETLEAVHQHWHHILSAVQIDTPDPALNILANGWLMYQTIACRLWARSGYYQSGGAFGFRDQLQDAMAVIHTRPDLLRAQLLLCAVHQFIEGDVQHWWHPPSDRGVRTKCSDDYLWLPLAVCRYVFATGDHGVLDEQVHFLEGRPVNPDEDSYYDLPGHSQKQASLYQHCVLAIEHGLRLGVHGLPLMGSCDWNDGMDKVGEHGKGESVWLAFFLYDVLQQFGKLARLQSDDGFAERCTAEAAKLRQNVRSHGWDGAWYRRAYFDDGTPLGSATNSECQIDSISQSWSVLSGGGDPERSQMGMAAVDQRLVRREHGLVQLLDPPFDKASPSPGYIRGYVPGVRENGGQYTHAAIWTTMAFAQLGDRERTWELLQMINPINHANSPESIATYKVEPYVVAADVYAVAPHIGRGGWTWYTGSAGWMYRLILESLLGVRLEVDRLYFTPCLPPHWNGFSLDYRYRQTPYRISVVLGNGSVIRISVDGVVQDGDALILADDGQPHAVEVQLPAEAA